MASNDEENISELKEQGQEWKWSKGETNPNRDVSKHRGAGLTRGKKQIRTAKIASKRAARASKSESLDDYFDMKAFGIQLFDLWTSYLENEGSLSGSDPTEGSIVITESPAIQLHARDVLHRMGRALKLQTRERGSGGKKAKRRVQFLIPSVTPFFSPTDQEIAYSRIVDLAEDYRALCRGDNVESVLSAQKEARKNRREKRRKQREGSSRISRKARQLFVSAGSRSTSSSSSGNSSHDSGRVNAEEEDDISTALQGISFVGADPDIVIENTVDGVPIIGDMKGMDRRSVDGSASDEEDLDTHIGLGYRPSIPAAVQSAMSPADWEQHTTGIGSKLLQKMGYSAQANKLPTNTQRVIASWDEEARKPSDRRGLGN